MPNVFSKIGNLIKTDKNQKFSKALSPLDLKKIKKYLKKKVDPNYEEGEDGNTLVRLLDKYLKIYMLNQNRRREVFECAKLLIDAGANLESKNAQGETPLHIAVLCRDVEITKYLLEKGANPNARDKKGATPFLDAAFFDFQPSLTLFLEKKANINLKSKDGKTPLYIAVKYNDFESAAHLLQMGADPTLSYVCEDGVAHTVEDLIKLKPSMFHQDKRFNDCVNTLSHSLATWPNSMVVREIRTYARLLHQGFQQNNKSDSHPIFKLPIGPLSEVIAYLGDQKNASFNQTQKIQMATYFFKKPPTKADIQNESNYIAELIASPKTITKN